MSGPAFGDLVSVVVAATVFTFGSPLGGNFLAATFLAEAEAATGAGETTTAAGEGAGGGVSAAGAGEGDACDLTPATSAAG